MGRGAFVRARQALPLICTLLVFASLSNGLEQGNPEILGLPRAPDVTSGNHPLSSSSSSSSAGIAAVDVLRINGPAAKYRRVPISTVALLTFLMAVATGLGTVPFFFFDLDDSWKGVCNGMACGVMLAASFDLVSEGQAHGGGHCVALGIVLGGVFIIASQRVLESFGDVKMMDLKGASARRMVLIVAIMTLHSFGEGSGVGVSFAGPRGFSKGLLVTLAIAVHNVPEGMAVSMVMASRGVKPTQAMLWSIFTSLPQPLVAVPAYMCAGMFDQFLPLCMGFAAGCMIWIVFGEVLPEAIQEGADASQVASAATVSVAAMQWIGSAIEGLEQPWQWHSPAPFLLTLLFILGPLLGGLLLVALHSVRLPSHSATLTGIACGAMLAMSVWQPWQMLASGQLTFVHLLPAFASGLILCAAASRRLSPAHFKKASAEISPRTFLVTDVALTDSLPTHKQQQPSEAGGGTSSSFLPDLLWRTSPSTRLAGLGLVALALHAAGEGLMLGAAAAVTKSGGFARMLLPAALHSLPRGSAAAAAALGAGLAVWPAVLASLVTGIAGPALAMAAMAAGLGTRGLGGALAMGCGALLWAGAGELLPRAVSLDRRRALVGTVVGACLVVAGFLGTRTVCSHTSLCSAAPEALT